MGTGGAGSEAHGVSEVASEQLGVERWERPAVYRDAAVAATSNDLRYWIPLVLAGAIATLGLALDSSAVVIGATLVSPLLSPVVGLAMALAVGDGRLAVQTTLVLVGSTLAVVATGALLTAVLPFRTITDQISSLTRPTTLDLAIAVFSGLVGAMVTVARERRLSAAVPGVTVSVALLPPLATTGFGVGSGWDREVVSGSLLLYGANLAGIVLSGTAVFLLVRMHGPEVVEAARKWHEGGTPRGLAALADRARWVRSLHILRRPALRLALVLGFVAAVWVPLSHSLREVAREARVNRAVDDAEEIFEGGSRAAVLGRQVSLAGGRTRVYLRVATDRWFGAAERERFERRASALAGEPVRLTLEQLPATRGDLEDLAGLLPPSGRSPRGAVPPPLPEALGAARVGLESAVPQLALPDGVTAVGAELSVDVDGATVLRLAYAAPDSLPPAAEQMLAREARRVLQVPSLVLRTELVSTAPRGMAGEAWDTAALSEAAALARRYPSLLVELTVPAGPGDSLAARGRRLLAARGVDASRVVAVTAPGAPRLRLRPAPDPESRPEE